MLIELIMKEHFEPIEQFWRKPPEEQAHIWRERFIVALVIAVAGWTALLFALFSTIK